jgi:hypothetical protein
MPVIIVKKSFNDKDNGNVRVKSKTKLTVSEARAAKLIEYGYAVLSTDPEGEALKEEMKAAPKKK